MQWSSNESFDMTNFTLKTLVLQLMIKSLTFVLKDILQKQ